MIYWSYIIEFYFWHTFLHCVVATLTKLKDISDYSISLY